MATQKIKKAAGRPPSRASVAKPSDIDEFLAGKNHPLAAEILQLRRLILEVSPTISEEIKWNSVSFRNQNDFFATVHLRAQSSVQLILFTGVKKKATAETGVVVSDPQGLIEKWLAKDRCLVSLGAGKIFKANRAALATLIETWIRSV